MKPQIVVLLYAVSKPRPPPLCVPACQKVSADSSRACRVALTVFVLVGSHPENFYHYKKIEDGLGFDGINFPANYNDIDKFERTKS